MSFAIRLVMFLCLWGLTAPLSITSFVADFTKHPDSVTPSGKVKLVRYQENPTPNWGPARKATGNLKRKRSNEGLAVVPTAE